MARKMYIKVPRDTMLMMRDMPDDTAGMMIKAIAVYAVDRKRTTVGPVIDAALRTVYDDLDAQARAHERRSVVNSKNAMSRYTRNGDGTKATDRNNGGDTTKGADRNADDNDPAEMRNEAFLPIQAEEERRVTGDGQGNGSHNDTYKTQDTAGVANAPGTDSSPDPLTTVEETQPSGNSNSSGGEADIEAQIDIIIGCINAAAGITINDRNPVIRNAVRASLIAHGVEEILDRIVHYTDTHNAATMRMMRHEKLVRAIVADNNRTSWR